MSNEEPDADKEEDHEVREVGVWLITSRHWYLQEAGEEEDVGQGAIENGMEEWYRGKD